MNISLNNCKPKYFRTFFYKYGDAKNKKILKIFTISNIYNRIRIFAIVFDGFYI